METIQFLANFQLNFLQRAHSTILVTWELERQFVTYVWSQSKWQSRAAPPPPQLLLMCAYWKSTFTPTTGAPHARSDLRLKVILLWQLYRATSSGDFIANLDKSPHLFPLSRLTMSDTYHRFCSYKSWQDPRSPPRSAHSFTRSSGKKLEQWTGVTSGAHQLQARSIV